LLPFCEIPQHPTFLRLHLRALSSFDRERSLQKRNNRKRHQCKERDSGSNDEAACSSSPPPSFLGEQLIKRDFKDCGGKLCDDLLKLRTVRSVFYTPRPTEVSPEWFFSQPSKKRRGESSRFLFVGSSAVPSPNDRAIGQDKQ
jgi:hypothetical protein